MMKRLSWISLFLILFFTLAGCAPAKPTVQVVQSLYPTKILSATATNIPTSSLTRAISDTGTPIPTATAIPFTATPSPTITLMAVDTLEPDVARATIEPLLQKPMNCDVPCFWGIVPEKTSFDEARIFFSQLGFTSFEGMDHNTPSSGMYFYTISYDSGSGHPSSVTLYISNNSVKDIVVNPDIRTPREGSTREWIAYSPETLIKRYGSPSQVQFAFDWQQRITINMIMYFASSDLIVAYRGVDINLKQFCPLTAPFYFVRLWMGRNPPHSPSFETIPLEKATSLTVDQFSQLMIGDPKKACITFSQDVYP